MTQIDQVGQVGFGAQVRKSPYFEATQRWGAAGYSVYNHMYIPRDFGDPVQNFWNLLEKMSQPQLCVLLQFCTGSRYRYIRIPPAVCAFLQYM